MWVLRGQPDSAVSFHGGDLAIGKGFIGNKNKYQGWGEKEQVLARCEVSTLVIDSLCGRARGQNGAVACFYFDLAGCRTRHDGRSAEVLDELD